MNKLWLLLIDLLLVTSSTVAALILRENLQVADLPWSAVAPYICFTLLAATATFAILGVSRAVWRLSSLTEYLKLLLASVVTVIGAVVLTFGYNRLDGVARSLPILQGLVLMLALVGTRVLMRLRHLWRDRRIVAGNSFEALASAEPSTVLVVGLGPLADLYLRASLEFGANRVRIAGLLGRTDRHVGRSVGGFPVLGTPEEIDRVLRDLDVHGVQVDQIVVAMPRTALSHEATTALELAVEATRLQSVIYFEDAMGFSDQGSAAAAHGGDGPDAGTLRQQPHGSPAADAATPGNRRDAGPQLVSGAVAAEIERRLRAPYWRVKRLIDGVCAFGLLWLMMPVFAVVSLVVLYDVGAPVTFWQRRPGRFGRPIKLFKFRTMRPAFDWDGNKRAVRDRVSGIGHFLRRTRLDELPQLWNILIGEMSFVGPRPLLPVDQSSESRLRLLIRPGLTGWAQVKGGRDVDAADKAALDIWYILKASLTRDFEIVRLTVPMVLRGERMDLDAIRAAWRDLRAERGRSGSVDGDRPEPGAAGVELVAIAVPIVPANTNNAPKDRRLQQS